MPPGDARRGPGDVRRENDVVLLPEGMIGRPPKTASQNLLAGLALMMALPVVLVFVLLQRYLLNRLLIGQVEG